MGHYAELPQSDLHLENCCHWRRWDENKDNFWEATALEQVGDDGIFDFGGWPLRR